MADVVSNETKGKTFQDIPNLSPWILSQLKTLKVEQPTPIQYHCIPEAINGKDIIGAAKTGSGKTLAFVIPVLQKLSIDPYGIFALVLTPTRELACQIADQFRVVGAPLNLKLSLVIGGFDKVQQGGELSRAPHVVVATPGRLVDILETSPEFTLKKIKYLILDEADRLMDGRFAGQLKTIWEALPDRRQTLLFSATVTDRIHRMLDVAQSDVFVWESSNSQATVQQLQEQYVLVNPVVKDASMVSILLKFREENKKGLVIIFTDTCKSTQILSMMLNELGVDSVCLHSMIKQKQRLASLAKFKSSLIKVLIATDLAGRGLDIPLCELVINHTVPNTPKNYIHRVGRTARAGRKGTAVTFITPKEIRSLLGIESETKRKMTELEVDESVVRRIVKQVNVTVREQRVLLDETDFDERNLVNKRKKIILQGKDPDEEERRKKRRKIKKQKTNDNKTQER